MEPINPIESLLGNSVELYSERVKQDPLSTEQDNPDDSYYVDYNQLIKNNSFIGDYPFSTIIDGITEHFDDYINIEDDLNYVDIFYDQWHKSRKIAMDDQLEFHKSDILEALDDIQQLFIEHIKELFKKRLTLTINDLEDDIPDDPDDIEYIIRTIYDYFIIDARKNFKSVITKSIVEKLDPNEVLEDEDFFTKVNGMLNNYSPLIRVLTPEQFLKYSSAQTKDEIISLFEDGKISGNFLRKYSCKLYRNEELMIDIINQVSFEHAFHNDILSASNQ